MAIDSLGFYNLRALHNGRIALNPEFNFFTGDNGSGKSSIIEAMSIALTARSFRTNRLVHTIRHTENEAAVSAVIAANHRIRVDFNAGASGGSRKILLNEKLLSGSAELASLCPLQLISPESFHLIDTTPSDRRRFMDWLLFHVEHSYFGIWKNYQIALKQRNALLKSERANREVEKEVVYWDEELAKHGSAMSRLRADYSVRLLDILYQQLETTEFDASLFTLSFQRGYRGDDLLSSLQQGFQSDRQRGFTQSGCHKADWIIRYDDALVKDVFSRGQKKLLINLMYLAQLKLLKQVTGKPSVFVIDDFTSELDEHNQQRLLQGLSLEKDLQIFVTGLTVDAAKRARKVYNSGSMFHVEHGQISLMND